MKDESEGNITTEFAALRQKTYFYLMDDSGKKHMWLRKKQKEQRSV